jgi:putative mRNA 3-end processing factor
MSESVVHLTSQGLYCPWGDFYIDPWHPVSRALITHAHADHARVGSAIYLVPQASVPLLRKRLRNNQDIRGYDYGQVLRLNAARVSFHPAGHVLGSAQVRIEVEGEIWVISGDFKREPDPTCEPFQVVPCDTLITEATFALPIYRWRPTADIAAEIFAWWESNRERGKASVLFAYPLGKAQRVLAALTQYTDRPVLVHGAVDAITHLYRQAGVNMLPTCSVSDAGKTRPEDYGDQLIIAPPGSYGSTWMRRFGTSASTGFCSGWMAVRGNQRRRAYDRGFVLSDHADWPALLNTIAETGARRVLVTHGHADPLVRYLNEQGLDAAALETLFGEEETP